MFTRHHNKLQGRICKKVTGERQILRSNAFQSGLLVRLSGVLPCICGIAAIVIGSVALLGWMFDPAWLARAAILHLPTNPVTAICIVLGGLVIVLVSFIVLNRADRARQARDQALHSRERFNRLIAAANPDPICLLDEDGIIGFANEATVRVTGRPMADIVGQQWGFLLDAAGMAARDTALATARTGDAARLTIRLVDARGLERWYDTLISMLSSEHDWPYCYLAVSRDVTEKHNSEQRDQWSATHDTLTELPNRTFFQEELDQRLAREAQESFAVLLVDIDNFKLVNDTLGHDAGDALLRTVARRISHTVREGDIVSRVAGDEFAVLLADVRNEQGALAIADRIIESFRDPWVHKGRMADCRISIGVTIAPKHGHSGTELLKNVDIALYVAKSRGKAQGAVFRSGMKTAMQRQTRQIELGRNALRRDLIVPYYQPKVALASGHVAGFEALLRWRHPHRGVQLPATIAAAFEDMELAGEITERMLGHVIADIARWIEQDVDFGHVAINLTAADLRQADFADRLLARLDDAGIPHRFLQVEVTETVFLGRGAEYVERALKQLNANGIRVALDDFGTGYASLSHLKQFPVDIVKIDRSFVQDLECNAHNDAIINTVISLGHSLNIEIVAEGIETYEQERRLTARGCTYGQGFFFGKAAPAARVPRIVAAPVQHQPRVA